MSSRRSSVAFAAAIALSAVACSSESAPASRPTAGSTSAAATEPADDARVGPGAYQTVSFMPKLRVELPDDQWSVDSDAGGELDLAFSGDRGGGIRISKGLFPVTPQGEFLTSRMSPAAAVAALIGNARLSTSNVTTRRLGDGLRARVLDVGGRPAGSVPFLAYKGVGLAGISFETEAVPTRVYVALIRAPYGLDLVDISVRPDRARDLEAWSEQAEKVLRTISLPPGVRAAG